MKVCIYGAGAIGGYIGVLMARAGIEVSLVARGAHLQAMQANGLTLRINGEELVARPRADSDAARLGPQDFVIVGLKAHQAWEAVDAMQPLLGPETAIVTAQNGLPWWYFHGLDGPYRDMTLESVDPGARQWRGLGPQRAIGCTVYPATEIVAPGVIKHIYGDRFGLGEPSRMTTPRLQALHDLFAAAGLKPKIHDDIRDDIWLKLWGNLCFNPISVLTRATLDVIATDPGTRAVARAMMVEAQAIGGKIGVQFRVDVDRRIDGAAAVGAHRTSMLQDLDKNRPIELDALLTSVQELGRMTQTPTPAIDTVLALTKQMGRVAGIYPVFPES